VGLEVRIRRLGQNTDPVKFRYQLAGGHGMPIEGVWYTSTFRNALTCWIDERGTPRRDFQDSRSIGIRQGGEKVLRGQNQRIQYAGTAIQFFATVMVVDNEQEHQDFLEWARPTVEGTPDPKKPYLDDITTRVVTQETALKPGDELVHKYLLYNGPVKVSLLGDGGNGQRAVAPEILDRYIRRLHLNTLTDYQMPHWFGENFLWNMWTDLLIYVTNLMHFVLFWLHRAIRNYGICVILLTVLVRGLMHPVSRKQARTSMKMQALAPELKKLQEKFKDDPQGKQRAMMDLYRKHGVHPMGSCWIIFLQMPVFLGLYYALQESIHFRLAQFLWIKNLAAPDMLIRWGESIPWISQPADQGSLLYLGPFFNLLPVLAVALMIVQQKFLMPPPTDEQQEMQQKMMKYMMVFMGIMFYKVASGLCIYFIASSLWGIIERKLLPKTKPVAVSADSSAPPTGGRGDGAGGGRYKPGPRGPKPRVPKSEDTNGMFGKVKEMWAELLEQAKKK
jgi:YidC/Oxa1 family membrane protein insertase